MEVGLKMLPVNARFDQPYRFGVQPKTLTEYGVHFRGIANVASLVRRYLGSSGILSQQVPAAAFGKHVVCVLPFGSQEQMGRANAAWVVAMVQHAQAFWNWAVRLNPDVTGSLQSYVIAAKNGIARSILDVTGQPTGFRFGDLCPEQIQLLGRAVMSRHYLILNQGVPE